MTEVSDRVVPDYEGVAEKREMVTVTDGYAKVAGQTYNLYGCSLCGAVVAYTLIPVHTEWHNGPAS